MKKTTSKATIRPPKANKATTMPKLYRLPDGKTTRSQKRYLNEWEEIGNEFGTIIGGKLSAFDPNLQYSFDNWRGSQTFDPVIVTRILEYIADERKKLDASYNCGCFTYK